MTALATSADVEAVLGRTLTADESARVTGELDKASAYIRAETRRPFDAAEVTVERKVRDNGTVTLVDADTVSVVTEVGCDGTATTLTGWTQRGNKVYRLAPRATVEVTHTRSANVPEALVSLCAQLAAAGLTSEAETGVQSQTITKGPFTESFSYGAGGHDAYALDATQSSVLRAHSRPRVGSVSLL